MANNVPITPPRVPLVDPRTGDVTREWYRFFFSQFTITGSASGVFPVTSGGTGLSAIPTDGQLLIGNGTGYALNQLTAGQNIAIGNAPGNITVSFDGILPLLNGGTGADNATDARANLGATTIGSNLFTLPDPSAITFPQFNADNTVTPLNATDFRSAIGAGTVTSVGGTGTVNGITLTGTVTTSGNLTLGGTLSGVDLTTQVTGILPIANGGTNATTAADARTNLGLGTMATQNTGATGSFLSGDLTPKTITVVNGIITSIV